MPALMKADSPVLPLILVAPLKTLAPRASSSVQRLRSSKRSHHHRTAQRTKRLHSSASHGALHRLPYNKTDKQDTSGCMDAIGDQAVGWPVGIPILQMYGFQLASIPHTPQSKVPLTRAAHRVWR